MPSVPLYPMKLTPALHTKVWGGRRLQDQLNIPLPTDEQYGEAWIMHDTATVANGHLRGQTIAELLEIYGQDLVGANNDPRAGMPLLAKFLDANDWLSIQVHPNDAQAQELDGEARGKTEAWYVLSTMPDSQLIIGVQPGHSRADLEANIATNTLESLMMYANVEAGDVLFIAPGTIHALGTGVLIYEIQQSSDLTYRLYDYGRPREIHVEKALAVSNIESLPAIRRTSSDHSEIVTIIECPYFVTLLHQLRVGDYARLNTGKTHFHILTCIEGETIIEAKDISYDLLLGETYLIPAALGEYRLRGRGRVLRSFQP